MLTVLLFILILAILILVHELGHFGAAKLFGVKVEEFGLGFPPRLFGKKIGETTYTLNAIPLGGFVKIFGEDGEEVSSREVHSTSEEIQKLKSRSFAHKPKWMQVIILSCGILMNILFGYLLLSIGFMIGLPAPVGSSPYGQVTHATLVITSVLPHSPADNAGLIAGDVIVSANAGQNVVTDLTPDTVAELVEKSQSPITLTFEKGNAGVQTVTLTPSDTVISGQHLIGITMDNVGILKLSPIHAFVQGAQTTAQLLSGIVIGLWNFFHQLFIGKSDLSQVSGPIGIEQIVGQASSIGFVYLLSLVALISLNLAVINLIPIPALDGGRLFFILIESITRRKISPRVTQWATAVSFTLLLILMVVVSVHDVLGLL